MEKQAPIIIIFLGHGCQLGIIVGQMNSSVSEAGWVAFFNHGGESNGRWG